MPVAERAPQTLYDKVLQAHIVDEKLDGTILLYIGSSSPLASISQRLSRVGSSYCKCALLTIHL